MDIELIRDYCLKKKGVSESFPFDEDTLVFKVMSKIFLLVNLTPPQSMNLKCRPEKAVELRELYPAVKPGYHMNKKHWNTVDLDNLIPDKLQKSWIDDSYELVVKGLKKSEMVELSKL